MQALASSTKPQAYQLECHRLITSLPYLDPSPSEAQLKVINQLVQDELSSRVERTGAPSSQTEPRTAERLAVASTSFRLGELEKDIETPLLDRLLQTRATKSNQTHAHAEKEEHPNLLGKRRSPQEDVHGHHEPLKTQDEYDNTVLEVERLKQR